MAKLPSTEEIDAATTAFEPYFKAVGRVVHAWNHLQEEFGSLFCDIAGLDHSMGFAIWQSVAHDRGQRTMLEAALDMKDKDDDWHEKFPKARESIRGVLHKANEVSEMRNNAIHAPCSITVGDNDFELIAVSFFGNQRAKKLHGKDILREFAWYEACADAIRRHVRDVQFALSDARVPWPDKLRLPAPGQAQARKAPHRQSDTKSVQPPPRSSRA